MKMKPGLLLNFTILLAIGIACKSIDQEDGDHNLSGNSLCTAKAKIPENFIRLYPQKVMTSQVHGKPVKDSWYPEVYFDNEDLKLAKEIAYYKKTKMGGKKLVRHQIEHIGIGAFSRVFLLKDIKLAGKDLVLKLQRPPYGAEPTDYIRMKEYGIYTGGVAAPVLGKYREKVKNKHKDEAYNIIAYGEFIKGKSPEKPQDFPTDGIDDLVEYIDKTLLKMAPPKDEDFTLPNDIRSVNVIARDVDKKIVPIDVGFQSSKLFRDNEFTTKAKALQLFGAYFLFEMLSIDVLRHDSSFSFGKAVDQVQNTLYTRGLGSSLGETHRESIRAGIDKLATTLKSEKIQPIFDAFYTNRLIPEEDRATIKNRLFERLAACLYPGFGKEWCVGEIQNFVEQQKAETLANSLFDLKKVIKQVP